MTRTSNNASYIADYCWRRANSVCANESLIIRARLYKIHFVAKKAREYPLLSAFQTLRRARALARTRVKLRRPYRLQTTLDLGELVLVARYDASREKACTASLPQAPYDSATRGIPLLNRTLIVTTIADRNAFPKNSLKRYYTN